jgi:hypothetical protein
VLSVSQCALVDLDGLAALPALRELYASFNSVACLEPIMDAWQLEVLDLEGNCICSQDQLEFIGCCEQMRSLHMAGNPVASMTDCVATVLAHAPPGLQLLDDQPVKSLHAEPLTQRCDVSGHPSLLSFGAADPDLAAEARFVCFCLRAWHTVSSADTQGFGSGMSVVGVLDMQRPQSSRPAARSSSAR